MIINKNLYGDGSRNCHLRCEEIQCEHSTECSLYKEHKCKCVTTPFGEHCKIGHVNRIDGGTKQGRKYYALSESVRKDPLYNNLKYPSNCYFYKVGNTIILCPTYVRIKKEGDKLILDTPLFGGNSYYMDCSDFTYDFLKRLCEFVPYSLSGMPIKNYQEKILPFMLKEIKKLMPEFYNSFINLYPQFEKEPNYIGRMAFLSTLSRDCEYKDCHGNKYHFENGYLIGKSSSLMPFSAKDVELKITISEDMIYTIDDNSQVLETTKFV